MAGYLQEKGHCKMQGLDIRFDKTLKVGQIISSMGEQIAVADTHEVWVTNGNRDNSNRELGKMIEVGDKQPCIRINAYGDTAYINTNQFKQSGIVCFLPIQFTGKGIISVKITQLHRQSVNAIPLDYVQVQSVQLGLHFTGDSFENIKQFFPNAERIKQGNSL